VLLQSDVFSHQEEAKVLASDTTSIKIPYGLNNCMEYFLSQNFFVRATQEIRELNNNNF
jgi:hypothetical protein